MNSATRGMWLFTRRQKGRMANAPDSGSGPQPFASDEIAETSFLAWPPRMGRACSKCSVEPQPIGPQALQVKRASGGNVRFGLTLASFPLIARPDRAFASVHPSETAAGGFPLNLQPRRGQRNSGPRFCPGLARRFTRPPSPSHGLAHGASAPWTNLAGREGSLSPAVICEGVRHGSFAESRIGRIA